MEHEVSAHYSSEGCVTVYGVIGSEIRRGIAVHAAVALGCVSLQAANTVLSEAETHVRTFSLAL